MAAPPSVDSVTSQLDALQDELTTLEPVRHAVPNLVRLVEHEITRLRVERDLLTFSPPAPPATAAPTPAPAPPTAAARTRSADFEPNLMRCKSAPVMALFRTPAPLPDIRQRVKIPVPADRFPDFNFVGRLLGPRGATLKHLERETRCRIMIRGRGSIRKDKEAEVRGKPGWEHVFTEPLHVVVEAEDGDEGKAREALERAREAIELLLVPVPEEKDSLKRQQLRDLAILNGTFRGGPAGAGSAGPIGSGLSRGNSEVYRPTDSYAGGKYPAVGATVVGRDMEGGGGRRRLQRHAKSAPRASLEALCASISPDDVQAFAAGEEGDDVRREQYEPPSYETLDFKAAHAATVRWMDQPTPRGDERPKRDKPLAAVPLPGGLGTGLHHYNGAFATTDSTS